MIQVDCPRCRGTGCSDFWPLRQTCENCDGTGSVVAQQKRDPRLLWLIVVIVSLVIAGAILASCTGDRLLDPGWRHAARQG